MSWSYKEKKDGFTKTFYRGCYSWQNQKSECDFIVYKSPGTPNKKWGSISFVFEGGNFEQKKGGLTSSLDLGIHKLSFSGLSFILSYELKYKHQLTSLYHIFNFDKYRYCFKKNIWPASHHASQPANQTKNKPTNQPIKQPFK